MAYCSNCGKEVTGAFCSNCGSEVKEEQLQIPHQQQKQSEEAKINIMALVGFVIACVSVLINFWGIVGIVALVFSVVGLVQIYNGNGKGKGFSIAGIVIGGISVLYGFIVLLILML